MGDFVDFVLDWLDKWEITELEKMLSKRLLTNEGQAEPSPSDRRVDSKTASRH